MGELFFRASKLAWSVVAPETLLVILVVAGWIALLRGSLKWAKALLGTGATFLLVLAILPVGEWVLYPLESRFPAGPRLPDKIAGIVVLGGAEDVSRSSAWGQVETNGAAERFSESIALLRRYPSARLVFTSGSAALLPRGPRGADVAMRYYESQGIDRARLLFEKESRNTAENAVLSKALANPAAGEAWILVTSASHMPRAVGTFCKAGWPVIPYPVDHGTERGNLLRMQTDLPGNLLGLSSGLKEWVGLAAYFTTGRSSALLPSGCAP